MIKELLTAIPGVESFQVLSLLIFFPLFVGITVWAFKGKKSYMNEMSALPLNDGTHIEPKIGD